MNLNKVLLILIGFINLSLPSNLSESELLQNSQDSHIEHRAKHFNERNLETMLTLNDTMLTLNDTNDILSVTSIDSTGLIASKAYDKTIKI